VSKLRTIPIPLPMRGLNTVDVFRDPSEGWARELTNYSILNGRIYMRPAVRVHAFRNGLSLSRQTLWFDVSSVSGNQDIVAEDGNWYRLTTGVGTGLAGVSTPNSNCTAFKHISLSIFCGVGVPRNTTSPFAAAAITPGTITAANIICGCSHRGRLYYCDGSKLDFSNVGATAGANPGANNYDLTPYMDGQTAIRIFSVTAAPNVNTENMLVVFGNRGKVLIYSGTDPGSPTWALIANYSMPTPVSNVGFVEIDGDIWVSTKRYAYWFRDLFQGGAQTAWENSPSRPIENIWQGGNWASTTTLAEVSHSFYEPTLDAVITQTSDATTNFEWNKLASYQNEGACYVYFRKTKGWAFWMTTPFFWPVQSDGGTPETIYGAAYRAQITKLEHDYQLDEYNSDNTTTNTIKICTSWKTPYFNPFDGNIQVVQGLRAFYENTWNNSLFKVRAIYDMSDYNAPLGFYTQPTASSDIPPGLYFESTKSGQSGPGSYHGYDNSWSQYNYNLGLGGQGGGVSFQISQTVESNSGSSSRQSIYGVTAYVGDGGQEF